MRLLSRATVAVVVLLAATACAGIGGTPAVGTGVTNPATTTKSQAPDSSVTSPEPSPPVGSSEATGSSALTLASGVTIDELRDDLASAQEIVNGFWVKHWSDFFTGSYEPPTVKGLYDGSDPADTPTCDGEPLDAYNAHYCGPEDYVAWDAGLLVDGADVIGDSWVYLVIAHEWGHAIQARLNPSLVATAYELQADCLGAAALYGAVADGTLKFEMGDDAELIGSLTALADQMPWTMTDDHGDSFQRVQWFTLGRNGGVQACLDAATNPGPDAPSTTG